MPRVERELTLKDMMSLKPKFLTIISRYQIASESTEDVLNDFILKMLKPSENDGLNYLQRYNGSTTLSTWFYKPLKNLCYSIKQRENSKGGSAIVHAARVEEASERDEEFDGSALFLENYSFGERDITSDLMVSQLIDIAKDKYAGCHSRSTKGYPRSPYFVVCCLYNGLTKAQTSKVLEVSTTFVESLLNKFLKDKQVIQIKEEYLEAL